MKHLIALGLTTALLLTGCGGGGSAAATPTPEGFMDIPQPVPTEMATPAEMRELISFEGGENSGNTKPFVLNGNYAVSWKLSCGKNGGVFGAFLERTDGVFFPDGMLTGLVVVSGDGANPSYEDGETNLYNIPDAEYYLDITDTFCDWSVVFTPSP